jgi:hypothetical protein
VSKTTKGGAEVPPDGVTIGDDFPEIHNLSLEILRELESKEIPVVLAIAATCLTLGRLISMDKPISKEKSEHFIEWLAQQAALYFTEGTVQ